MILTGGKKTFDHEFLVAFNVTQLCCEQSLAISERWQEDSKYHTGLSRNFVTKKGKRTVSEITDKHSYHTYTLKGEQQIHQRLGNGT